MSLFSNVEQRHRTNAQPLAARMRPNSLDQFVGQTHFLAEGRFLRRLLKAGRMTSLLFYGPPGTGKTTLARLLARETDADYRQVSAVESSVKQIREILAATRDLLAATGQRTLLFVDEIHRFSKSQQDVLLHDVEDGVVILVGATTSNPMFAVNGALVSRSQIFEFKPLSEDEIRALLDRALTDSEVGLGQLQVTADNEALEFLASVCDGDARRALNTLEVAALSADSQPTRLTTEDVAESMQRRVVHFDPTGDTHYDLASALIKSIRGSDPDAAIYWLARMLESGEDIRFITRRLVILASEDIGNADPHALSLAVATMQACEFIGLPECQLSLSQAVTYLACAEKSNAATLAIGAARRDVADGRVLPVPSHLRDGHYAGAERLGHGQGYVYAHDDPEGVVAQDYLGERREYYHPVHRGYEQKLAEKLSMLRARLQQQPPEDVQGSDAC